MTKRPGLWACVFVPVALAGCAGLPPARHAVDGLTFSGTMRWDAALWALSEREPEYLDDWETTIQLPAPPANSSEEVKRELRALLDHRARRTAAARRAILEERDLEKARFGAHTIEEYMDGNRFPATSAALRAAYSDVSVVVMALKRRHDRVRPSVLEPKIDPAIAVPPHPAYPSGHSSQAHLVAHFLGELMPARRAELEARALEVAVRREIAGVHYASDTRAGISLAKQVYQRLLANPRFRPLLEQAKREWSLLLLRGAQ